MTLDKTATAFDLFSLLSPAEIGLTFHSAMRWHYFIAEDDWQPNQRDRFETHPYGTPEPVGAEWQNAVGTWCTSIADALLLASYVRSRGGDAVLLWDLVENPEPQWCVVIRGQDVINEFGIGA